jgi:tetratricopeptide (TPR) repeat protein
MSPEQFQGRLADARSDQFSFSVALHEALFGARPFFGRTLDELARNVVAGNLVEPATSRRVPAAVRLALTRGLRVEPQDRFPTMKALLAEIEKAAGAGRGGFAAHAAAKLAGVWEAPIGGQPVTTPERAAMQQAFLATGRPYAASSFTSASATLDRYTERWSELYVEICEATHVSGEQSAEILDLRMAFLTEGLDDLKALCRLFREATAEVVSNADKAASALPNLERCRDVAFVRNAVRPPQDFETRVLVDGLRARLAEARAFWSVGRLMDALSASAALVDEARSSGYEPLLAEALLMRGKAEYETSRLDPARVSLEEAFSVAEEARHDEVAAEAAMFMMSLDGYLNTNVEAANVWGRYAEAILRRMGSHDLLWGWYFNNRANVREMQGRLAESVEDSKRAIEAKTRALGARAFDVALSIGNLANHLAFGGDFAGALETSGRALSLLLETAGPDHPRTALWVANRGQFLFRLNRFDEADDAAARALAILERETDRQGPFVTIPLRTLGLCHLARGRFEDARAVLERAVSIREATMRAPLRLAEVHAPLARALHETGARARALELARKARAEYEHAARTPLVEKDLTELERWLAAHDRPPRAAGLKRKTGSPPRPRRASRVGRRPSSAR